MADRSTRPSGEEPGGARPGSGLDLRIEGLHERVHDLRERIREDDDLDLLTALGELEVAQDELRVAALAEPADGVAAVSWVLMSDAHEPRGDHPDPSPDDLETAAALSEMCRLPLSCPDRQGQLRRLTELVEQAIPRAHAVSLTLGAPDGPEQIGSNKLLAQEVDAGQLAAGEGPCIEAYHRRSTIVSGELLADPRWPALTERLGNQPVGGAIAVPVTVEDRTLGVLNVYAGPGRSFTAADETISGLVASSVSAVLRTMSDRSSLAALAVNLETALQSRAVIDQAKGIVMARYACTAEEAFQRLSAISQRSNRKLRDVALLLVNGVVAGEPTTPFPPPAARVGRPARPTAEGRPSP